MASESRTSGSLRRRCGAAYPYARRTILAHPPQGQLSHLPTKEKDPKIIAHSEMIPRLPRHHISDPSRSRNRLPDPILITDTTSRDAGQTAWQDPGPPILERRRVLIGQARHQGGPICCHNPEPRGNGRTSGDSRACPKLSAIAASQPRNLITAKAAIPLDKCCL